MTKTKLNASTAINMQLLNIKKDGDNGDLITVEFMADDKHVVASEWVDVVKDATLYENDMMRRIDFGGATIDGHIEANGITVNNTDHWIYGNNGTDFEQATWNDAVYFYIIRQMQRFIRLPRLGGFELNELDIDPEAYVGSSLQVTSVKGWQVEGADTDEKVFFYKLALGNASVSFFAWVYIDGELVEFCLDERDGLDEAVMAYYRHIEQDQFSILQIVVEGLKERIADRENDDLFDWDEEGAAA